MRVLALFCIVVTVFVVEGQLPDCIRATPTSGCTCNDRIECPKDINLRCNLEKQVCEVFFDETNTFPPCTNGLCPLENQFCYYDFCVFVPFVVKPTLPTLVFTKPTLVFTTPRPVTRKPIFVRPIVRPCFDFVHPGRCFSECPMKRHLCDVPLYYDLMTLQCPKTCNRCYDNFNVRCPYRNRGFPGYPGIGSSGRGYPSLPTRYNPCNGIME